MHYLWAGAVLLLLLLSCSGPTGAAGHVCGHEAARAEQARIFQRRILPNARAPNATTGMRPSVQTRLQRLLSNSVPSKIRVTPVFQLAGSYMSAEQTYQLQQSLIPGAIHVLQKYIQLRIPSTKPIKALRRTLDDFCGPADASAVFHGDGYSGTDMVFYVTAQNGPTCRSSPALAYTLVCHLEPFTYRPNVAALNICPAFWKTTSSVGVSGQEARQLATLVHEMTHGLGFMDNLHTFYYNPKTGVQYDSVVQPVNAKGSSGPAALYMVTPKTRALARAHFGCPSLPGAPVDVPSGGSHWLQQAINHELMQPATAEDGQRKRMSAFTLAFLEDTGWYKTNLGLAESLEWGRNAGCAFALGSCGAFMRRQPQQTYFCPREQRKGDACTFDQRGIGSCDDAYGNRSCFTTNSYVDRPVIMCDDASSFALAEDKALWSSIASLGGSPGAPAARCMTTATPLCRGRTCLPRNATCMSMACDAKGSLYLQLNLSGQRTSVLCPSNGLVNLAKRFPKEYTSGVVRCPDASFVCRTLGCAARCRHGRCWEGRCECFMEYGGSDCSQSLVPQPPPPPASILLSFTQQLLPLAINSGMAPMITLGFAEADSSGLKNGTAAAAKARAGSPGKPPAAPNKVAAATAKPAAATAKPGAATAKPAAATAKPAAATAKPAAAPNKVAAATAKPAAATAKPAAARNKVAAATAKPAAAPAKPAAAPNKVAAAAVKVAAASAKPAAAAAAPTKVTMAPAWSPARAAAARVAVAPANVAAPLAKPAAAANTAPAKLAGPPAKPAAAKNVAAAPVQPVAAAAANAAAAATKVAARPVKTSTKVAARPAKATAAAAASPAMAAAAPPGAPNTTAAVGPVQSPTKAAPPPATAPPAKVAAAPARAVTTATKQPAAKAASPAPVAVSARSPEGAAAAVAAAVEAAAARPASAANAPAAAGPPAWAAAPWWSPAAQAAAAASRGNRAAQAAPAAPWWKPAEPAALATAAAAAADGTFGRRSADATAGATAGPVSRAAYWGYATGVPSSATPIGNPADGGVVRSGCGPGTGQFC